jgi:hypothetical protein
VVHAPRALGDQLSPTTSITSFPAPLRIGLTPGAPPSWQRHPEIPVIAEAIEGWQQLQKLRELGCALAQGQLLSRPASASDCLRFPTDAPLDFVNRDGPVEMLEMSGIGPINIAESLECGAGTR